MVNWLHFEEFWEVYVVVVKNLLEAHFSTLIIDHRFRPLGHRDQTFKRIFFSFFPINWVKMFTQSLSKVEVVSCSQETFSQKETWTLTLLNVHCLCCSVISLVVHSLKCAFSYISSFWRRWVFFWIRGRSLTMLTKFCPFLTTYLARSWHWWRSFFTVWGGIFIQLTSSVPLTYLVLST